MPYETRLKTAVWIGKVIGWALLLGTVILVLTGAAAIIATILRGWL